MAPYNSSGRVIFLNRFFYPDHSATSELVSGLAFALVRRGFRVISITSRQNYETVVTALPPRECVNGVDTWRVWTSRRGRLRLMGRSLDYLTFYLSAGWRLWRLARAGDIIVTKTDPPLLSLVSAPIAWLRGAHLVNWLQDIFPEVAEALNVGGSLARVTFRVMRPLRNWSLRFAKTNVVVGEGMVARLQAQGIGRESIRVIPNWSDGALIVPVPAEQNELRKNWAPNSRFIVGYAGNLGRAHDVDTITKAMTILQKCAVHSTADDIAGRILFVFIGGGALRAKLEREMLKRRLTNVRLYPYQPREHLAETLGVADVHLVSLNPKLEGLIVPSKFYGIAAAGRPTLFIGAKDGEIARLIDEAKCGFTISPGDAQALVDHIMRLAEAPKLRRHMGARARAAFDKHWTKDRAVDLWEEALNVAARTKGRTQEKRTSEAPRP
jgi:colanic acid biosynthesis glycosyl transferase WcaI